MLLVWCHTSCWPHTVASLNWQFTNLIYYFKIINIMFKMFLDRIRVNIIHMNSPFQVGTASLLIFPIYYIYYKALIVVILMKKSRTTAMVSTAASNLWFTTFGILDLRYHAANFQKCYSAHRCWWQLLDASLSWDWQRNGMLSISVHVAAILQRPYVNPELRKPGLKSRLYNLIS